MPPATKVASLFQTPPRHTIDLSLPPSERYKQLALAYKDKVQALTGLFDQLLEDLGLPPQLTPTVNKLSRILLRRVHESEQTKELKGISQVTGIAMYLLVALNVVLDLMMGCTSGGVRSREEGQSNDQARMLHFRTLDWGMDPLRDVIVQLDFVRSKSKDPTQVIASSITYVGFVGVLTGVRTGLSMSLNFRAVHEAGTKMANFRFYLHHLMVLLGWRPSIASLLRSFLLPSSLEKCSPTKPSDIATLAEHLDAQRTTAAYIILSNGETTLTMEKDHRTSKIDQSQTFIVLTNHDISTGSSGTKASAPAVAMDAESLAVRKVPGLEDLLEDSKERLGCIRAKWEDKVRRSGSTRAASLRSSTRQTPATSESDISVTKEEIIQWLCAWSTTNETTHFACVLDAKMGQVAWSRTYLVPISKKDLARIQRSNEH